MKHFLVAFFVALPFAAAAQTPRSIADCEKIKGDLAYNECLARFGPKMGERAARTGGDAGEPAETRSSGKLRGGGRLAKPARGGRQRASFEIGARGSRRR